ncbi:Serine carboxypeptidase 24 [Nymphaea thermarum]|nr:Serine carboxypeptidase 24 [Nymphaea thermarum]
MRKTGQVGNPVTYNYYDNLGTVNHWWSMRIVDTTYKSILKLCNFPETKIMRIALTCSTMPLALSFATLISRAFVHDHSFDEKLPGTNPNWCHPSYLNCVRLRQ